MAFKVRVDWIGPFLNIRPFPFKDLFFKMESSRTGRVPQPRPTLFLTLHLDKPMLLYTNNRTKPDNLVACNE